MQTLRPIQDVVYGLQQRASSAVLRRRYRGEFTGVQAFCLFVGYPRSGHSIFGACLNAHRDAVISHELGAQQIVLEGCSRDVLYSRILARASWFNLRGNRSNYRYAVPNQWQGRFDALRVIGDKRGGAVTRCIAEHPSEVVTVRHEELIREPGRVLADVCAFLGLELYPRYVEDCASIVFKSPTYTRRRVDWSGALLRDVEERIRGNAMLQGYGFGPQP